MNIRPLSSNLCAMSIKVLVISSSPRAGGNTDLLADEVRRGAAEAGADTEKIMLRHMDISPCMECGFCARKGKCRIEDDMYVLYDKFLEYHRLVLAAPIYFMAHCAQAKIMIDRCQAFWSRKYVLKQPLLEKEPEHDRIGAFVSCGGTKGEKVFAGAKVTMKYFFDVLAMEYGENLLFNRIDDKGDVLEHPTGMKDAFELGTRIGQPWKKSN